MRPHLRVISINTNFCNNLNFWLLLNFADPHYHLHWLYKQLHKAEMNKEKVYLLGHIPPGSDSCLGELLMSLFDESAYFKAENGTQVLGNSYYCRNFNPW